MVRGVVRGVVTGEASRPVGLITPPLMPLTGDMLGYEKSWLCEWMWAKLCSEDDRGMKGLEADRLPLPGEGSPAVLHTGVGDGESVSLGSSLLEGSEEGVLGAPLVWGGLWAAGLRPVDRMMATGLAIGAGGGGGSMELE